MLGYDARNVTGSLMANLTGNAPVTRFGIHFLPAADVRSAARCGKILNVPILAVVVEPGVHIWIGMTVWRMLSIN